MAKNFDMHPESFLSNFRGACQMLYFKNQL